ncbi:MAG: GGDEF domain-containing protein [Gammaproteobacteria bacterium]|nr:GGDEF domain-containing protein [Gammaproteobacteria bacterium]
MKIVVDKLMCNWLKPWFKLDINQTLVEFNELASMLYLGVGFIGSVSLMLLPDFNGRNWLAICIVYAFAMYWLFSTPRAWLPLWPSFVQVPVGLSIVVSLQWIIPLDLIHFTAFLYPLTFIFTFHFYSRAFFSMAMALTFLATGIIIAHRGVPFWPVYLATTFGATLLLGLIVNKTASKLHQLAKFDSLTGLMNRHFWEASVNHLIALTRREKQPLSIVFFDIDKFKKINDEQGHLEGDKVLKRVSEMLKNVSRESDLHGRWGGDEFAIALPNTNKIQAQALIDRLQIDLGNVKVSPGVVSLLDGDDLKSLLNRADSAMYDVKMTKR